MINLNFNFTHRNKQGLNMENIQVLINILQNTFSPNQQLQHQAEHDINQLCVQPGFMSALLQIAINNNIQQSIRLAAVIYLKNFVSSQWNQNDNSHISENDKTFMKQNILQAIVHTPQQLKYVYIEYICVFSYRRYMYLLLLYKEFCCVVHCKR